MTYINVAMSIRSKQRKKLWELHGVSTPVNYVTVGFLPEDQGNRILVSVHEDNIKILRLKKLRFFKAAWSVDKIAGYNSNYPHFLRVWFPSSWKEKRLISIPINNFLRYLLDETWKDF